MTHTLEVADVGKTLALKVGEGLVKEKIIPSELLISFITIAENACLLHDVGNPPFGHFGEEAIRRWFSKNWKDAASESGIDACKLEILVKDLLSFDGNPQGLRIIMRLLCENDEFGLNLSLPTLLSCIKYPKSPEHAAGIHGKKPGFFLTESKIVSAMWREIEWPENTRYPIAYIMEAADDICYCLSDIADAFEKRMIRSEEFKKAFVERWERLFPNEQHKMSVPTTDIDYFGMQISVSWSKEFVKEATDRYLINHEEIWKGTLPELIDKSGKGRVLKVLKEISRDKIYRAPAVQSIELAGFRAIFGLLDHFAPLLRMKREDFAYFVSQDQMRAHSGFDLEWRLYNRLAKKYVRSYNYQLGEQDTDDAKEWVLRAHLIVDHISGMTDNYALYEYQVLHGISTNE
jgi:dGTPase